jgi:hypothetical protein
MDWEGFWKIIPSIIQAVSVAATAYFASRSLNAWRNQLIGKRKFEVAEDTIVAAYKARDALDWIRNPGVWSSETIDRPTQEFETESEKRLRDTFFVPIKRIKDTSEDFAQLGKMRHLCQAHFGDEASSAIDEFFKIRNAVSIAANMLIEHVGEPSGDDSNKKFYADLRWEIWGTGSDKDKLKPRIDVALQKLSDICTQHLR